MSQKRKSSISFGPGASSLILIFVVLSMSVLGMLSLMNSRNDIRLSQRSASVVEAVYALNVQAEESRARVDAILLEAAKDAASDDAYLTAVRDMLPENMTVRERLIEWTETDGLRKLSCALEVQPLGSESRALWARYSLTSLTEEGAQP